MLKLFQGIRPLNRAGVLRDALAGVALAAINIPQVLGYSRIAGMPVVSGLYTLLLPLVAFATFGSSRFLVVSADSATAAILAAGLGSMAAPSSQRYIALAGLIALLTAALLLLARLFELGFIADFLPQTVLVGFLTGVGLQVGIAVLGQALGVPTHSHRTLIQLFEISRNLRHIHLPTLLVSAAILAFVLLLSRFAPKVPGSLLAVVVSIAASAIWNFEAHGIVTLGPVAGGLPKITLPSIYWHEVPPLLTIAASCTIMIITQSAATARIYAARHQQRLNEDQDLIGLSAANAAAALIGAFPVNGSPTQTAAVESAGARSQVAQLSTAIVVAIVLLFLTRYLQYLPQCVLGSLVLLVAIRLIKLRSLTDIRRESSAEFALAVITAAVVVTAGVEPGILLAMAMSLFRIVQQSYRPHTGVMALVANGPWKIMPIGPGVVTEPGLVLYRFGAALFYANAGRFSDEVLSLAGPAPSPVRWIIVDAEAITHIDYSASRVIIELQRSLKASGVALGFARVPWDARADMDRHHLTEVIGTSFIFNRLHDALDAYAQLPPVGPPLLAPSA